MSKVLVTGGAGYVGASIVQALVTRNYPVVVVDDLEKGRREFVPDVDFHRGDLRNRSFLEMVLDRHAIDAVVHASLPVEHPTSEEGPGELYRKHLNGLTHLLDEMVKSDIRRMVLSSTRDIYGWPDKNPIEEEAPVEPRTLRGRLSLGLEHILRDYHDSYQIGFAALRCFTPSGSLSEAGIGPFGPRAENAITRLLEAMRNDRRTFTIQGTDYPTRDGTFERDFIHLRDLATAHVAALDALQEGHQLLLNVGSGNGVTVRELAEKAMEVTGSGLRLREGPRTGDQVPSVVASTRKILSTLDWSPEHSDLETILQDAWHWHTGDMQKLQTVV